MSRAWAGVTSVLTGRAMSRIGRYKWFPVAGSVLLGLGILLFTQLQVDSSLGVAFFVPFLWFAWVGAIKRSEWPRMLLLFVLGGLQGFVGWWMVQSGLETRVSVSQYRLAIHLGFALLLLGAILWTALEYLRGPAKGGKGGLGLIVLVYIQMLLGALVAGLHAGLVYNTWPSMDGRFFPEVQFAWTSFFLISSASFRIERNLTHPNSRPPSVSRR